ncbi:unnamed protein product [Staurois parvus]|uniref:Uncharacterized protein n=1 Tax=Staurois parvus TaxID=386267 RepID=A0ABN9E8R7_9NEOB|nr:unnamed protein product [Staurois parvus]
MESQSMRLSMHCCANLKATRSLEVFSYCLCRQLATSWHCALQNTLTSHCQFTGLPLRG